MKTYLIPTFACLYILFAAATAVAAALTPKGLIIYTDPPSSYVEACEYASLESGKPVYSTIVKADGERLQLSTGGLWVVVNYPSSDPQAIERKRKPLLLESRI